MPDLQCAVCVFSTGSLKAFVDHYKVHSNEANFNFPCGVPSCRKPFRKYASFRSHMYRDHRGYRYAHLQHREVHLQCQISFCASTCKDVGGLLGHLKRHIAENVEIQCPFKACTKAFSVRSSFTAHISRSHRERNTYGLCESIVKTDEKDAENNVDYDDATNELDDDDHQCKVYLSDADVVTDSAQFVHNLGLFYLKLQAKFLLPASIIQSIVEEMQKLHTFGLLCGLKKLSDRLSELNVCESDISDLLRELQDSNPFRACTSGELRTHQMRQMYFKKNFKFVAPTQIYLGENKHNVSRFAQYVPIKDSLKALFEDASVKAAYNEMQQKHSLQNSAGYNSFVLDDIADGRVFVNNQFFTQNPGALRLILYQDAFEVANPLGSGKKKHKILAVYFSLANFPPHYRSTIDQIQLILLCCESDFKHFGQRAIFGELIKDLRSLEDEGLKLFDSTAVPAAVLAIVGDNLGSHCIGGFSENFSANNYVCRYCSIDRETVNAKPHVIGNLRTPSHYDEIVDKLEADPDAEKFGIKFGSVFNDLRNYHVCNPGLPPCLEFEGVVSRDVALIIKHFVKKDKYFTYEQLNRLITRFKYLGSDAENKPCELKYGADKIGGHAVQNWYFLRLLSLLVGDRIKDKENPVWIQLLLLREIVDLICAPKISLDQVALLKDQITEYLCDRVTLFPEQPVTPKHHYMAHYPGLILHFGPLMRVWTLRFESKHSYFKNCVRKLRNFKNICSTLADRHQLLQAYLSEGTFFPPQLLTDSTLEFSSKMYAADIQRAVSHIDFKPCNTAMASKATYRGTLYKPGMFVVIREIDDGLLLGRLLLVLVYRGDTLYFVVDKCRAIRCLDMGTLCVEETDTNTDIECLSSDQLLDYYPLVHYTKEFITHIVLHHAVYSSLP